MFVLGQKYLLKPVIVFILFSSAILSYFSQELGVVFDVDMVRNTIETIKDNNQQEATELISAPLIKHVLIYGLLPSLLLFFVNVKYQTFLKEIRTRLFYLLGLILIVVVLVVSNFKFAGYFFRENRDLSVYVTPLYAYDSLGVFIVRELRRSRYIFKVLGEDAVQEKTNQKRVVGIMVVGETARADNFSLNGYHRETNPKLNNEAIINYSETQSCGTSTAYSVPCMFSFLDQNDYSPEDAAAQSNVLDVLKTAGVNIVWIDNNSSCKGVCDRIGEINIRKNTNPKSPYYSDGEMFDEALLEQVSLALKKNDKETDLLLVLHTLGSHGPKYFKRYPKEFSRFKPACVRATPQECTDEEIINTYDNTILYTDHVVSQLIQSLKSQKDVDTFLFYASDHGESLGEAGIYLHGLPYFIAPKEQTHVPMFTWFSEQYIVDMGLDISSMTSSAQEKTSHDVISHTLLGAFDVKSGLYSKNHDLLKRHP